jgi:hypothetical protein
MFYKLKRLFKRTNPQYNKTIFAHRTWLDRQVQEAMFNRHKEMSSYVELGKVK